MFNNMLKSRPDGWKQVVAPEKDDVRWKLSAEDDDTENVAMSENEEARLLAADGVMSRDDVAPQRASLRQLIGAWLFLLGSICWTVDVFVSGSPISFLDLAAAVCFDVGCVTFLLDAHGL